MELIITKDKVSCEIEYSFRALEIDYVGDIKVVSLLKNNFTISKFSNKIIILNFSNSNLVQEKTSLELFKFKGTAMFSRAKIVTKYRKIYILNINSYPLENWNALGQLKTDADYSDYSWDYLTRNWEDMDYNGRNNEKSYIENKVDIDEETNIKTITRQIRKK